MRRFFLLVFLLLIAATAAAAGPFTDEGIDKDDPRLIAWAAAYQDYRPAADVEPQYMDPTKALGPATGEFLDIVSLGERPLGSPDAPGAITLLFDEPLRNRPGFDLAVFENSFPSGDGLFIELAFVEVSTDGENWARFPSVSLTAEPVPQYGTLDPTEVYNLAGKHQNAYGAAFGTTFDFDDLLGEPAVVDGWVDLDDIQFVRIVDIPGGGDYEDAATALGYDVNHPIYDAYPTIGSAGFDVEAVGVIDESHTDDAGSPDDDTSDDDAADDDDESAGNASSDEEGSGCDG
jgi:hypothetical protein